MRACTRVSWLLLASRPFPRSSRAKGSHEGRARGLCGEIVWQCVVRRASWGWCGARGAARSGRVPPDELDHWSHHQTLSDGSGGVRLSIEGSEPTL